MNTLAVPEDLRRQLLDVTRSFSELSAPSAPPPEALASAVPDPYTDDGLLGAGGMGEVRRVHDPRLQRSLAMKTLRPGPYREEQHRRFCEEAQVMAQLQHPGIPPVHEVGTLPDGRPYFTMLEVRGHTLTQAIREAHALGPSIDTLRVLVDDVQRVAETVAYAHSRGVVHRDLKPDNIMRGPFGEVWVMDWGLTRVTAAADAPTSTRDDRPFATRADAIAGTPAYMAPEQARGEAIGPRADVYALGGVLFTVLVGELPRGRQPVLRLLADLASSPTAPSPAARASWSVPSDLDLVCRRAMAADPGERYAHAGELADDLAAFLTGHLARQQGRALVNEAVALDERVDAHRRRADALRRRADDSPDTPEGRWALLDLAEQADAAAHDAEVQAELLLQSALSHADLPEAHDALADRYVVLHRQAEARGDGPEARRYASYLQLHGAARYRGYLAGDGLLTLHSEPPATATLYRLTETDWRLQPTAGRELGPTPIDRLPLPRGSWLVDLRAPGHAPVRYPVHIGRGEHWHGVPPGGEVPQPIRLPRALSDAECFVPAGWFVAGRDNEQDNDLQRVPRQLVWCDDFVVAKHPVTNTEFIAFLDALVDQGREEEALRHAPQFGGSVVWSRDASGHFLLGADAQGDEWQPDAPVVLVDWEGANAFAAWRAECDGVPWRLGSELEWEKAARGVDGRPFPWGHRFHPSFCRMRDSTAEHEGPAPVGTFPADTSVYGVRHCAGNVTEWLADPEPAAFALVHEQRAAPVREQPSRRRRLKGGAWMYRGFTCRVDGPASGVAVVRLDYQGFRLFRSVSL